MLVALSRNDAKRCGETCVAAGVRTLEETPPDGIPQLSHKHYAHISHIFHDRAMSAALHTTPLAFDFAEGVSLFHFFLGPQQFRHTSLGILSLAILRRFTCRHWSQLPWSRWASFRLGSLIFATPTQQARSYVSRLLSIWSPHYMPFVSQRRCRPRRHSYT